MFVVGRLALSLLCLGLLAGVASAATPKPADHHGYRWGSQRLLCTSVKAERRPNDKVVITYKGRRYWCSRPPLAGTAEEAGYAMRYAISKRFDPASTTMWPVAQPECKPSVGKWLCKVDYPGLLAATATVTYRAKGAPLVVFTSFECRGVNVGRPGC